MDDRNLVWIRELFRYWRHFFLILPVLNPILCLSFSVTLHFFLCIPLSHSSIPQPTPWPSPSVPVSLSSITGVDVCLFLLCRAGSRLHMARLSSHHLPEYSSRRATAAHGHTPTCTQTCARKTYCTYTRLKSKSQN